MEQQTNSSNRQPENNWNSKNSKENETRKLQKWKQSSQDMKKNKKPNDDPEIATKHIEEGIQETKTTAVTAKVATAAITALNEGQFVVDVTQPKGTPQMNHTIHAILPENHDIVPDDMKGAKDHQNEDRIDAIDNIRLQARMIHLTNHRIEVTNEIPNKIFGQPLNHQSHLGIKTTCSPMLIINGQTNITWHHSQCNGFNLIKLQCHNIAPYQQCNQCGTHQMFNQLHQRNNLTIHARQP